MILRYFLYSLLLGVVASIVGATIAIKHHPERFTNFMGMDRQLLKRVPQFQLEDIDGKLHTYTEWNGHILVLNFWATWCQPCREETPGFVELQEKYREQGVQFVGIAIDDADEVRDFMDSFGITYPMLMGNLQIVELSRKMGNRLEALPFTVIVDRHGYIAKRYTRGLTKQDVEAVITSLLDRNQHAEG
ncbi:MAG: TlpA disulfide reductase family protein [Pseudomonadota bacterium]